MSSSILFRSQMVRLALDVVQYVENRKEEVLLLPVKVSRGKNWRTTNSSTGFIPPRVPMFSELCNEFSAKIRMTHSKFFSSKRRKKKKTRESPHKYKDSLWFGEYVKRFQTFLMFLPCYFCLFVFGFSHIFFYNSCSPYFVAIPVISPSSLSGLSEHLMLSDSNDHFNKEQKSYLTGPVSTIFSLWSSNS